MQSLMVSMVRFSAAVTLYSVEQIQSTLSASRGGQDLINTVDRIGNALDSLTDVLAGKLDSERQEMLRSVTSMAQGAIDRSNDSLSLAADPRELFRAAGDLVHRSSEVLTEWMGKPETKDSGEPQAAAAVLSEPYGQPATGAW